MSENSEVEWWGVVTYEGWRDKPADDPQSVEGRTERALHACEQAPGFEAWGNPGAMTVRWHAPDDLNAALRKLFEVTGINPMDFDPGRRPERVPE